MVKKYKDAQGRDRVSLGFNLGTCLCIGGIGGDAKPFWPGSFCPCSAQVWNKVFESLTRVPNGLWQNCGGFALQMARL